MKSTAVSPVGYALAQRTSYHFLIEEEVGGVAEQRHAQDAEPDHDERSCDIPQHRREHPDPLVEKWVEHDTCRLGCAQRSPRFAHALTQYPHQHRSWRRSSSHSIRNSTLAGGGLAMSFALVRRMSGRRRATMNPTKTSVTGFLHNRENS